MGTYLVKALKEENENEVISLIHSVPVGEWQRECLFGTRVIMGDVRDHALIRSIISRFEVDCVYHLAAIAKVKTAFEDPLSVYDTNVMGAVSVLEACRKIDVDKVVLLQTDKVYGEKLGALETDPYQASEPYGTGKACQGLIAQSYIYTYDMNIAIPHCCNIFGYDPYSNRIFPNVIKKCIKGLSPLIFTNDKAIREYIYIEDLVERLKTFKGQGYKGPYNIKTGWIYNQKDIVLKILEWFPNLRPRWVEEDLPKQIQEQTMDTLKSDWVPAFTFEKAIDLTVKMFKEYRGDWR